MTQVTQVTLARNTKHIRAREKQDRIRNRNWCFTLNNYTEKEIETLQNSGHQFIFQEETGENGTPHLQGCMFLTNAVGLKHMKGVNPRAHWEICKNKIASIQYCSKESTRTGKIYTNMDLSKIIKNSDTNNTTQKKKIINCYQDIPNEKKEQIFKEFLEDVLKENITGLIPKLH